MQPVCLQKVAVPVSDAIWHLGELLLIRIPPGGWRRTPPLTQPSWWVSVLVAHIHGRWKLAKVVSLKFGMKKTLHVRNPGLGNLKKTGT